MLKASDLLNGLVEDFKVYNAGSTRFGYEPGNDADMMMEGNDEGGNMNHMMMRGMNENKPKGNNFFGRFIK